MTHLADKISLDASQRERLPNGFLRVPAVLARTGIQTYTAGELGLKDRAASDVINVYRPAEEVFDPKSMQSFANKPVTNDHPTTAVTADNAKQLACGWTGETITRVGDTMTAVLVISDAKTIADIEGGKAEISNGYDVKLDWTAGTTATGETYQAVQRNIVGDHVAIVQNGRCGQDCRLADTAPTTTDCGCKAEEPQMKTITVDGFPVEVSPAAEAAITRLQAAVAAADSKASAAEAKLATDSAGWAVEKARLDAELTTARASIPSGQALDALVVTRTRLLGDAKRLAPTLDAAGKTDAELRKAAVTAKLGDTAVAGKPDTFFDVAFDLLVAQLPADGTNPAPVVGGDPLRDALSVAPPVTVGDQRGAAWAEGVNALADSWKRKPATAAA